MDMPLDLSKKSLNATHSATANFGLEYLRTLTEVQFSDNCVHSARRHEPLLHFGEFSSRQTVFSRPTFTNFNVCDLPEVKSGKKPPKALLPCEVCKKTFDRPSLLKRHIRTHTGEKPHVCEVCSKGFSTSSSLNTHRRIHTGLKPHVCGYCGKRFTASSNLYYHRMTHTKIKPHKCTLCTRSFPTPGDLRSHMYVHSGTWPFRCHICSRGFSKQTNLRNHVAMHTGNRPFVCEICNKKFALQCNLKTHVKIHHKVTDSKSEITTEETEITPSPSDTPSMSAAEINIIPEFYKNWLLRELPKMYMTTGTLPLPENHGSPFQYTSKPSLLK